MDLDSFLPRELDLSNTPSLSEDDAHVLWDQVQPPFAFFENGEPTASQTFYQFTVLRVYDERGVLVRDVGLPGTLRVSAGTEAETTAFLDALASIGDAGRA